MLVLATRPPNMSIHAQGHYPLNHTSIYVLSPVLPLPVNSTAYFCYWLAFKEAGYAHTHALQFFLVTLVFFLHAEHRTIGRDLRPGKAGRDATGGDPRVGKWMIGYELRPPNPLHPHSTHYIFIFHPQMKELV